MCNLRLPFCTILLCSLLFFFFAASPVVAQNATFAPPPPPATTGAPTTSVADELTLAPPAAITTTASPDVKSATNVAEGSSITAGIMSATAAISTAAGPVVASVASRVGVVQKLASCNPSLGEELPFFANPTGASLKLGDDKADTDVMYHVGAILANIGILIVFALLSLLIASLHNRFWIDDKDRGRKEREGPLGIALRSYGVARWPGVFVFPAVFFAQPMFGSGLTIFFYGKTGAAVIGLFGILVITGLIVQIAIATVRSDGFLCTYRTADQLKKEERVRRALMKEGCLTSLGDFYINVIECSYGRYFDIPTAYEETDLETRQVISLHKLMTAELLCEHGFVSFASERNHLGTCCYEVAMVHGRFFVLSEMVY